MTDWQVKLGFSWDPGGLSSALVPEYGLLLPWCVCCKSAVTHPLTVVSGKDLNCWHRSRFFPLAVSQSHAAARTHTLFLTLSQ
jgi:hypothetical protein